MVMASGSIDTNWDVIVTVRGRATPEYLAIKAAISGVPHSSRFNKMSYGKWQVWFECEGETPAALRKFFETLGQSVAA